MKPETEYKNFIDHYGIQDTLDAITKVLQTKEEHGHNQAIKEQAVKEFVEQLAFYFELEI